MYTEAHLLAILAPFLQMDCAAVAISISARSYPALRLSIASWVFMLLSMCCIAAHLMPTTVQAGIGVVTVIAFLNGLIAAPALIITGKKYKPFHMPKPDPNFTTPSSPRPRIHPDDSPENRPVPRRVWWQSQD